MHHILALIGKEKSHPQSQTAALGPVVSGAS